MVTPESPECVFTPGNVIEFGDITELATFEDLIAKKVEPVYDHSNGSWPGRIALRDLIRPLKFNGTIADIKLEVMKDPYERLLDARQRGWAMPYRTIPKLANEFAEELIPRYRGFVLTADAKSSGKGTVGQIQAEMWYYPMPLRVRSRSHGKITLRRDYSTGETLRRVVSRPRLEEEKFIELDATARRIGVSLLRQSLVHPIYTPMRD